MSYSNLTNIKTINGLPADTEVFSKLTSNDHYLNTQIENDDDLSSLNRSIIPETSDLISLGSILLKFKELFVNKIGSSQIVLETNFLERPSIKLGDVSLVSAGSDQLSFIGYEGAEALRIMSSGVAIRSASSNQLELESTNPGSESIWRLGGDANGFNITGLSNILTLSEERAILAKPLTVMVNGMVKLQVEEVDKPNLFAAGSIGYGSLVVSSETLQIETEIGIETETEIDVTSTSKVLIDTSTGAVSIEGFRGGREGQILHIVKLDNINTFSLVHNSTIALQSVLLKGSIPFEITNDFGGIILSFDQGQWREISRS